MKLGKKHEQITTIIKTDSRVVKDLEKKIDELITQVKQAINENNLYKATKFLSHELELYGLRGYTTEIEKKHVEIWNEYLKKFP